MRALIIGAFLVGINGVGFAQGCCSGGSGSPIAGDASTGVLQKNQIEFSGSYQFNYSDVYFSKDSDTLNLIDELSSDYIFIKFDYGLSERFTMSVAAGYYLNKTLVGLGPKDTITSSGISDLIVFPRYSIFNKTRENSRTEITLGLGLKIPLGSNTDSNLVGYTPELGDVYTISPPTVQVTSGSQDLMLYTFWYQGYQKKKLHIFANTLYIRKGYNSMGEKFGDYASLGLFVGKTIFKKVGLIAQIKGEWIGKMKVAKTVGANDIAIYSIDTVSSGSKKVFFVPQVSYTHKNFTVFATSEIPLYQCLTGVQVGSLYQFTAGFSYRFFTKKLDETPVKTFEPIKN
ncbi:MAG: hypothetical protein CO118_12200 [Flavobacteriales bacterium CG_4_9_14_3_um_filter_32_8]|nr:MAG: hypothetical protein CO118_12200 [Flavobacteriales bacterium CG_4_9_14_3_um_filter_32_8]